MLFYEDGINSRRQWPFVTRMINVFENKLKNHFLQVNVHQGKSRLDARLVSPLSFKDRSSALDLRVSSSVWIQVNLFLR